MHPLPECSRFPPVVCLLITFFVSYGICGEECRAQGKGKCFIQTKVVSEEHTLVEVVQHPAHHSKSDHGQDDAKADDTDSHGAKADSAKEDGADSHGAKADDIDSHAKDDTAGHDSHKDPHKHDLGHINGDNAHGHAHGHAAAGHSHGHGHEPPSSVATALAMMLFGVVAFVMSLFYLTNSSDKDIRNATWEILSSMISIFCAVLLFTATKDVSVDYFGEAEGNHHSPPNMWSLSIALARFFVALLVVECLIFFFGWRAESTHEDLAMKACGTIGAHVVGFSAIEVFANLMQYTIFSSSLFRAIGGFLLCVLAIALVYSGTSFLRDMMRAKSLGHVTNAIKHQCEEAEDESIGLVLGLLISMIVRCAITGKLPPAHGSPKHKSVTEIVVLLFAANFMAVMVMCATVANEMYIAGQVGPVLQRLAVILQQVLAMTGGWCLLFWGQWEFWSMTSDSGVGQGDRMTARMIMALMFSAFVFISIFLIDFLADRSGPHIEKGLRALLKTLGLLMGLSWEATFTTAVSGIGQHYERPGRTVIDAGMTLALCALVLPAWAMYILPRVEAEHKHAEHQHADAHDDNSADAHKSTEHADGVTAGIENKKI